MKTSRREKVSAWSNTRSRPTAPRRASAVQFSEDLVKAGVDYTPFVTVDEAEPKSIEAEGRQICVEGLEHGHNYRIAFRPGPPAAIGEVLEGPVVLSIYIQDRAATARFTGDAFVLPSTARRGIPVVTVNMDVAEMKLFRVGDRSLAQLLSGYQFLRQLDTLRPRQRLRPSSARRSGRAKLTIANDLNKEVTTSFPVDEALPNRKPGVYVLTAQPKDDHTDSWIPRATQWFVVSDIGLSTYTGQDGLNVFARSLNTAKPIANADLTLLARNNEILGTAKTDAEGRATFNPGLNRGEGGMAPAVLMASGADQDFVFLDMTKAGFDLSDRGVAGREAPGALDVYAWTERGIYRAGETGACGRTCPRRRGRRGREPAAHLHLHAPRRRRGSPHRLRRRVGRRPCRRPRPVLSRHARHLDSGDPHRPEGGGGRQPGLPGRGLRARSHRVRHDLRQARDRVRRDGEHHRRRPLPLWRAGRRPGARRRTRARAPSASGTLSRATGSASPTSRKSRPTARR